jgi:ABC-type sugar transport system ATPase subunit
LSLFDASTVEENLFLGDLPTQPGSSWQVGWPGVWDQSSQLLARAGSHVRPQILVRNLSVAHKQMVEIALALARNVPVLILNEPTRGADGGAKA